MTVEPMGQRARRFEFLDVLRLLCAAAVVGFHYVVIAPHTGVVSKSFFFAPDAFVYGQFGVHVFFIISGFVITLSARGRIPIEFLWARFLRLYPAYWVCCTLSALVVVLLGTGHPTLWEPSLWKYLVNLTMLQSYLGIHDLDPAYWSLAVELRFYVMVAIFLAIGLRVDSMPLMLVWLICCGIAPYAPAVLGKAVMASFAPYFISGILIQRLSERRYTWQKCTLLCVAAVLAYRAMAVQHAIHVDRGFYPYDITTAFVIVCTGGLMVIGCVFAPSPKRFRKLMTSIGAMTYPLYLLHSEIGLVLISRFEHYAPAMVVVVGVILLLLAIVVMISEWIEPALRKRVRALGDIASSRWEAARAG